MRFIKSLLAALARLQKPRSYTISQELGRGREIADWEFASYTEGDWDELSTRRQRQLTALFSREPWNNELLLLIARHKQARENHDSVAHEQFMDRLRAGIASA